MNIASSLACHQNHIYFVNLEITLILNLFWASTMCLKQGIFDFSNVIILKLRDGANISYVIVWVVRKFSKNGTICLITWEFTLTRSHLSARSKSAVRVFARRVTLSNIWGSTNRKLISSAHSAKNNTPIISNCCSTLRLIKRSEIATIPLQRLQANKTNNSPKTSPLAVLHPQLMKAWKYNKLK